MYHLEAAISRSELLKFCRHLFMIHIQLKTMSRTGLSFLATLTPVITPMISVLKRKIHPSVRHAVGLCEDEVNFTLICPLYLNKVSSIRNQY